MIPGPGGGDGRDAGARGWTRELAGHPHGMENQLVPPRASPGHHRLQRRARQGPARAHAERRRCACCGVLEPACASCAASSADAVLGMGGYVCFPGGLMGALLGKPLLLVNADAGMLLSNRAGCRWPTRVAFGSTASRPTVEAAVGHRQPGARRDRQPARAGAFSPAAAARCAAGGGRQPGRAGAQRRPCRGAGADPPSRSARGHAPDRRRPRSAVRAAYAEAACRPS